MKKISIVTGCYNEEDNVKLLYEKISEQMLLYKNKYEWELIYIDNCSTDNTVKILKEIANVDKKVKIIVNSRNFGHIRSPHYAILNAYGDAVIFMVSDLQDPPELLPELIKRWEDGYKIVLAQKNVSEESKFMFTIRRIFYGLLRNIVDDNTEQIKQFTGFGLYDKQVVDVFRTIDDPYPYFRGLISEVGFEKAIVKFTQPTRKRGRTKNNFYTLYDMAMLGIVKHSKVPLRAATITGFILSVISVMIAFFYLVYKLIFWSSFEVGIAPLIIGLFTFASFQLFVLGLVGEYVGAIYTRVDKKPLVIEKERINF